MAQLLASDSESAEIGAGKVDTNVEKCVFVELKKVPKENILRHLTRAQYQ